MIYAILHKELEQLQILVSKQDLGTPPPGTLRGNLKFGGSKKVYTDFFDFA